MLRAVVGRGRFVGLLVVAAPWSVRSSFQPRRLEALPEAGGRAGGRPIDESGVGQAAAWLAFEHPVENLEYCPPAIREGRKKSTAEPRPMLNVRKKQIKAGGPPVFRAVGTLGGEVDLASGQRHDKLPT